MLRIAVLVSGGGTNLQAIIDRIEQGVLTNTEIVAVISNKKDAYALVRAKQHNIPTKCISPKDFSSRDEFNIRLKEAIDSFSVDLVVLAGYLVILPEVLIKAYRNRIINIHPSLIPSFCGAGFYGLKVHQEVLERGVKVTGATVHFVDEGTDTGPIILQKSVEVLDQDTPETLQQKVMEEAEWSILPKAIELIANDKIKICGNRILIKS
jgi:phosphoribosylglycinamide formyltransferase-1